MRRVKLHHALCLLPLVGFSCFAQARWCNASGKSSGDQLVYPPIGKAAHVRGTTLSRLMYEPSGHVIDVETISGPAMLARSVAKQVKDWTIRTSASGNQTCQSLLIVNFSLGADAANPASPPPPGILHVAIHAEEVTLSDSAAEYTRRHWPRLWRRSH